MKNIKTFEEFINESVNEMDDYSKDAHTIANAAMKYFSKRDKVNGEEWDSFMYDATVMDRSINISHEEIDKHTIDDVINILFDNGYNRIDSDSIGGMYESVNEKLSKDEKLQLAALTNWYKSYDKLVRGLVDIHDDYPHGGVIEDEVSEILDIASELDDRMYKLIKTK